MFNRPETAASVSYLVQLLLKARPLVPAKPSDISQDDKNNRNADSLSQDKANNQEDSDNAKRRERTRMGQKLRVFDLCTGTGCIPLLFCHEFHNSPLSAECILPKLDIAGFDVSEDALALARTNHASMISRPREQTVHQARFSKALRNMQFIQANVLRRNSSPEELGALPTFRQALGTYFRDRLGTKQILESVKDNDIWISNPPYISPEDYVKTTSQSVRDFEPKTALVPPATHTTKMQIPPTTGDEGDRFYQDVLEQGMELRCKVVLFEVADMKQAKRIATLAQSQSHWHNIEIWRDEPSAKVKKDYFVVHDKIITIRGFGNGRSVLLTTVDGADLINRYAPAKADVPKSIWQQVRGAKGMEQLKTLTGAVKGLKPKHKERAVEKARQKAAKLAVVLAGNKQDSKLDESVQAWFEKADLAVQHAREARLKLTKSKQSGDTTTRIEPETPLPAPPKFMPSVFKRLANAIIVKQKQRIAGAKAALKKKTTVARDKKASSDPGSRPKETSGPVQIKPPAKTAPSAKKQTLGKERSEESASIPGSKSNAGTQMQQTKADTPTKGRKSIRNKPQRAQSKADDRAKAYSAYPHRSKKYADVGQASTPKQQEEQAIK